jgi:hypothetical protein
MIFLAIFEGNKKLNFLNVNAIHGRCHFFTLDVSVLFIQLLLLCDAIRGPILCDHDHVWAFRKYDLLLSLLVVLIVLCIVVDYGTDTWHFSWLLRLGFILIEWFLSFQYRIIFLQRFRGAFLIDLNDTAFTVGLVPCGFGSFVLARACLNEAADYI